MADDFVQVPADSVGKKIGTRLVTRPDGTQVEQQEIAGPTSPMGDRLDPLFVMPGQEILETLRDIRSVLVMIYNNLAD